MKMVRCPYGHVFDNEQFRECPICAQNKSIAGAASFLPGGLRPAPDQAALPGTREDNRPAPAAQGNFPQQGSPYPNRGFQHPFSPQGAYPAPGFVQRNFDRVAYPHNDPVRPQVQRQTVKAQIYPGRSIPSEPVGGWLVCVMGNDKGKPFRVSTGKAAIGRSDTKKYKINLSDEKISRANPIGTICYVPNRHQFYFVSDPLGNLTPYVNGAPILTEIMLKDYDEIRIGSTVLLFRAFCSEKMNWDHIERRTAWQ